MKTSPGMMVDAGKPLVVVIAIHMEISVAAPCSMYPSYVTKRRPGTILVLLYPEEEAPGIGGAAGGTASGVRGAMHFVSFFFLMHFLTFLLKATVTSVLQQSTV
jgi:hypothetical protein